MVERFHRKVNVHGRPVSDKDAHFIAKPYSVTELTQKVREVLDS